MNSLISSLKGHRGQAIFSVGFLVLAIFLFCYSILSTEWVGTPILCAFVIVLLTLNLMRMTERSNENFTQFINNISHNDFSSTTSHSNAENTAQKFVAAQRTLLEKYRKLKADRSAQHEYLHLVVEHVDTALVCFDETGNIEIINQAAKELLKSRYINTLSRIETISPTLADALQQLKAGENRVLKISLGNEPVQLILAATEFRLLDRDHKLVSMQNIQSALDEKEIESWQKLIKVLTHEIMNSMTPIVSLSNHLESVVHDSEVTEHGVRTDAEQHRDIVQGIETIAARSQGLLRFVQAYRSLSNLPRPNLAEVSVESLFQRMATLLEERFASAGIAFHFSVKPQTLSVAADINLIEQILLNLLNNAIDAVAEISAPRIDLTAFKHEHGKTIIQVTDNGCGISKSCIDDIFTPFFTTKETGTGVGLSLSRQLARLNHASLTVTSTEGKGSSFQLGF
ncbi:MAG: ATP-binding protein [Gammaproteobacteria bacterium]|nr:ATP-binding protein [Gammaproteobacteria bacterium]MDP2347520.1 ATP-binding protein [Gammaproteobacteria bacterium]